MVLNLACVLAMWQIVVFSSCNMLHILPMYFEHVVSFRFGIQTTLGLYASLSSLLQAALGHETTVCVTFGARWRDTYFCRCHGCSTITCVTRIMGASSLAIRFSLWFGAHPTAAMSGLRDVDSQRWRLRMPCLPVALDLWRAGCAISCRMCVAASFVWRSRLRFSLFVSSLYRSRLCRGATSRSARAANSDG